MYDPLFFHSPLSSSSCLIANHHYISLPLSSSLLHTPTQTQHPVLYGVKLRREDMAEAKDPARRKLPFDNDHYDKNPQEYRGIFHDRVAPYITTLVNGMYWDARFPRLLTCEQAAELYKVGRA